MYENQATGGNIMHIGKAVKIALINKGKTQSWLANDICVKRQAINHVCQNETCNLATVVKIADALELKVSELIALGED